MLVKNIDPESVKRGLKEDLKLKQRFDTRISEIERNLGAGINFSRDYQDENYKYNYLRTKLIERGVIWKRKEYGIELNYGIGLIIGWGVGIERTLWCLW